MSQSPPAKKAKSGKESQIPKAQQPKKKEKPRGKVCTEK